MSIRDTADRVISLIARVITKGLFRSVEVVGFDNLPDGPKLIVANHFNGFVDPVVLTGALGRLPRFIAKATLWKTPGVGILMKGVGVLPVHRSVDGGGDNAGTFSSVVAELHNGHSVAIFPEGTTHDDQHLSPIKTGAARLALDALADGVDLRIIPAGITFEDKVALRSRVVIRAGTPIDPGQFVGQQSQSAGATTGSEDHEAVNQLTSQIRESIAQVSPNFGSFVEAVEARCAADLVLRSEPTTKPFGEVSLARREELAASFTTADQQDRENAGAAVAEYHLILRALGVRDDHLVPKVGLNVAVRRLVLTGLLVAVLSPLALMGIAVNAIPALLVALAGTLATAPVSKGTNRVLVGVVGFPLTWALLAIGDMGSGVAASAFNFTTSPLSPVITAIFDDRGGWGPSLLVFFAAPVFGLLAVWLMERVVGVYRLVMTVWSNTQRRGQLEMVYEQRTKALDATNRALPGLDLS